jgi:rSAM/selenodomain-associated transferase 1
MSQKNLLLIFTKNPIKGKVKTRLAKDIGDSKALEIYQYLLQHTRQVTQPIGADKAVFYADFVDTADGWDNAHYTKFAQTGKDLGDRMKNAFVQGFDQGYSRVVIIGSDCAQITQDIISEAFEALKTHDAVLGSAKDGGYYLLGMKRLYAQVFENKPWSTSEVFAQTLQDFTQAQATVYQLAQLSDIDTVDDLHTLPPEAIKIVEG